LGIQKLVLSGPCLFLLGRIDNITLCPVSIVVIVKKKTTQLSSLNVIHRAKEKQGEKQQERLQVHQDEDSGKDGEGRESGEFIGAGMEGVGLRAFIPYRGRYRIFPL